MEDNTKADKNPVKILIVEDSPTQAMQLQYMLERNNYNVLVAQNGAEALTLLNKHKPSIVISDIMMPRMDGYELCKQIKENESLRDIFVILLTALSEPQDVIKSLQSGADKFLTKPYDETLLLSTIQCLLDSSQLPGGDEVSHSIEVSYGSQKYLINSSPMQIINLLISTYEAAVKKNIELIKTQEELRFLNRSLEEKVKERTADLQAKNEELNIMSQQLWQAAKLATMGELAASIAHELNNPLATVNLRIESLLAQIPPDDSKRQALEVIEQEVDRMANLVANLLQFSRRSTQVISTLDVCKEINNTLELIHYHLRKHGITVLREFSPGIPNIHADRQQLRQLFLNLFTNSCDAMPNGGTLTIRVDAQQAESEEQRDRRQRPGVRSQKTEVGSQKTDSKEENSAIRNPQSAIKAFVVIEIADTGMGITPENMQRIMEPFFTTKPEGKGTGLGLPICRRIVREHNGTFNIESEAGKGTSIHIRLPVTNESNCTALKEKVED